MLVQEVIDWLGKVAPLELAEDWDNVGLLLGDPSLRVNRVMTCLTITNNVVEEAIESSVQLIVAHHPLPFQPVNAVSTTAGVTERMLWKLARAGVCIYSAHTAYDSCSSGINQQWAAGLGLNDIRPLRPLSMENSGAGRYGNLPSPVLLEEVACRTAKFLGLSELQIVGNVAVPIRRIAIACGSGGDFLADAERAKCDLFITGEARFHSFLAAEAAGIGMILTGHYASERFAMEELAARLDAEFTGLQVWASRRESDPLRSFRVS